MMAVAAALAAFSLSACGGDSADDPQTRASAAAGALPSLPPPITSPADDPDQTAIDAALVGLTAEDAAAAAAKAGYEVRVVSVDGEPRAMTMDFRTNRINLEIENDVVTRAYVG